MPHCFWSRARRALFILMVFGAMLVQVAEAPEAMAGPNCPGEGHVLNTSYANRNGNEAYIQTRCHAGGWIGEHWVDGTVYIEGWMRTVNLPERHCFEMFHNIDTFAHRAPDFHMNCASNTTKYIKEDIRAQDDGQVYANQVADADLKGMAVCITAQWDMRRVDGWTCQRDSNNREQPANALPYYDWDNVYTMYNVIQDTCGGCMRVRRAFGTPTFEPNDNAILYRREGSTRVLSGTATWTDYDRSPRNSTPENGRHLMVFQPDGNLVVYRINANFSMTATWWSGTGGMWGATLHLQSDGNMTIWHNGAPRWHSGTHQFGPVLDWRNSQWVDLFCAQTAAQGCKHLAHGGRI